MAAMTATNEQLIELRDAVCYRLQVVRFTLRIKLPGRLQYLWWDGDGLQRCWEIWGLTCNDGIRGKAVCASGGVTQHD